MGRNFLSALFGCPWEQMDGQVPKFAFKWPPSPPPLPFLREIFSKDLKMGDPESQSNFGEENAQLLGDEEPVGCQSGISRKLSGLLPMLDCPWRYAPLLEPGQKLKRHAISRHHPLRLLWALFFSSLFAFLLWNLHQTVNRTLLMQYLEEEGRGAIKKSTTAESARPIQWPSPPPAPPFNRWALPRANGSGLDCAHVLSNDSAYIARMATQRISFADPPDLDMDCEGGIRWRNYFREEGGEEERDFPLAQARIVYKDYVFLEMELAAAYSPANWYCYIVDSKAEPIFHSRMRKLTECLPNVLITPQEWNFDGGGHNITRAHLGCLQMLAQPERAWKYVALLQNHDSAMKTNRQMIQIYKWLDGANDVEISHLPGGRVNDGLDWSFEAIHMFKNAPARNKLNSMNGFAPRLVFSKGYVQSSLSREMAEFMLNELDLTETVRRLEAGGFGIDEILVPTLHAADALQAPGGFTHACLDKDKRVQHITRASIWYEEKACGSRHMRHSICVFGLEDLALHLLQWPHLFANKFQPDFDFGAILCWYEAMHSRSHDPPESEQAMALLDKKFYEDLAHVRFQKFKRALAPMNTGGRGRGSRSMPYREAVRIFNCTVEYQNANK